MQQITDVITKSSGVDQFTFSDDPFTRNNLSIRGTIPNVVLDAQREVADILKKGNVSRFGTNTGIEMLDGSNNFNYAVLQELDKIYNNKNMLVSDAYITPEELSQVRQRVAGQIAGPDAQRFIGQ